MPQMLLLIHPLHHAEDIDLQRLCVSRIKALAANCDAGWQPVVDNTVTFIEEHCEIIEKFGRFPHRNVILGRKATKEEQAFLDSDPRDYGQTKK